MTPPYNPDRPGQTQPAAVTLDEQTVDRIAHRVAALLQDQAAAQPVPSGEGRLLSAAQVAERWQIDRGWVYAHADDLGAMRLGSGPKPRLRFDPDQLKARLSPPPSAAPANDAPRKAGNRRGYRRIAVETRGLLPFRGDPELSSQDPIDHRPQGAAAPPATVNRSRYRAR